MLTVAASSPSQHTKFTLVISGEAPLDRAGLETALETLVGQVRGLFAQTEWATRIDPNCVTSIRGGLPQGNQPVSSEEQFYTGVLSPSWLTPMR